MSKPSAAATEPSMEEILASIRRIIADGDETLAGQAADAAFPGMAPDDIEGADEEADEDIFELTDDMSAQSVSGSDEEEGEGEDMTRSAFDDARVIHGFRAPEREPQMPDVVFSDGPQPAPDSASAPHSGEAVRDEAAQSDEAPPESSEARSEPLQQSDRPEAAQATQPGDGSDQLMSPSTDANVAAAFGKLASTMLTQDSRTLEDLVKEMLRPMLREWLDDNLPSLVERLVRAEIERVSRGRP